LGARVGHVFVATSLKATVLSAGFAGANRRRPEERVFQGWTCHQGRLAQLCFRQVVPPWLAPDAGCLAFIARIRGPGQAGAAGGARDAEVDLRWDGGGSHRLADPVASNCAPVGQHPRTADPSRTPQRFHQGHRLDAGPSAGW
jgi:hypothetical protein